MAPLENFRLSGALDGLALPELAVEPPTTLLTIHAVFTAQHLINELRQQFELGLLETPDLHQLAQLGKEIACEITRTELEKES